jgi:hypothetical protein
MVQTGFGFNIVDYFTHGFTCRFTFGFLSVLPTVLP